MEFVIALIAIAVYTLRVLYFMYGAAKERSKIAPLSAKLVKVSIIIPARNEEHNIGICLDSIVSLSYHKDYLEVIVVDDRSSDATSDIVKRYVEQYNYISLLRIVHNGEKNLQGKAGALEKGISKATGELILMTDADCVVDRQWVQSHVNEYAESPVSMVCAFTLINGTNLFENMQAVEWNTTHTMASASVYYKKYLGCYGNNLSIRKSVYDEIGGYTSIPFSVTEDLALMHEVGKRNMAIRYICSPVSSVTTHPVTSLRDYVQQHKRWAQGGKQLGWKATVFVMTSALLWVGLAVSLLTSSYYLFFTIALTRLIGDFIINIPSLVTLRRTSYIPYIVPAIIFFTILELVLPFLLIDRTITWKGQKFRGN
jgi:cellulose synthase/poly-beta-1,6-N-acetylglucosamine synthase-like glycosyltransferase